MISRRQFIRLGRAGLGVGLGTGLYTWRVEPHWVELVERPLPIANLPASLAGCRLVQLSDLHIGPRVDDGYLEECFALARRLSPDFVVYTGDFTDYEGGDFTHAEKVLSRLPLGRRGTLGILGNHDYGPNWSHDDIGTRVAGFATRAGVRMLRNEAAEIEGLHFFGLDDLWAGRLEVKLGLETMDRKRANLVLSHNPDSVDLDGWENHSGWILSGHTHGGQCKPPFLPPPLLPVVNRRYTAGAFSLEGGRSLYISRGVGHVMRVRFNVRPEITLFHLQQA